ncbi:MAG TPA: YceI family protein [Chitinophagales bacterium]|nr:YceI family protein [Chitinophagales bacterium]
MKTASLFLLLVFSLSLVAQTDKYAGVYACNQKGKAHFFSASPLEDIEATANDATMIINTLDKSVSAKVIITSFVFKDKLMREHFNENYLESDRYPNAILKMVIQENIDFTKDGVYEVTLKGTLEMHGVKQEREIKGKLHIKDGQPVRATSTFNVKLEDHKIKIPKAVLMNIAEVIKVDVDFALEKFQK